MGPRYLRSFYLRFRRKPALICAVENIVLGRFFNRSFLHTSLAIFESAILHLESIAENICVTQGLW